MSTIQKNHVPQIAAHSSSGNRVSGRPEEFNLQNGSKTSPGFVISPSSSPSSSPTSLAGNAASSTGATGNTNSLSTAAALNALRRYMSNANASDPTSTGNNSLSASDPSSVTDPTASGSDLGASPSTDSTGSTSPTTDPGSALTSQDQTMSQVGNALAQQGWVSNGDDTYTKDGKTITLNPNTIAQDSAQGTDPNEIAQQLVEAADQGSSTPSPQNTNSKSPQLPVIGIK